MIRGVRKRKAKIRSAHLQHLTLVEIETNFRSRKNIQHLTSLKIIDPFRDIPFNIKKSSIIIFLNEILTRVIREEEANKNLFGFIYNGIRFLDLTEESFALFHHLFLIQLTRFLGFYPENKNHLKPNFNLEEGVFTNDSGPSGLIANATLSDHFKKLLNTPFEAIHEVSVPLQIRNELLDMILDYYKYHLPGITHFKSHLILSEVLSE
jgi:DNA repair protein RecO (recombination protein O)